jgi:hypothetical protein
MLPLWMVDLSVIWLYTQLFFVICSSLHIKQNMKPNYVGFEVFPAVVMTSFVLCDITLCSPLKDNLRSRGTYCLHLQGRRMSHARNHHKAGSKKGWFLVGLFFGPKDGSHMFPWNVDWLPMEYTVLYPRNRTIKNKRNSKLFFFGKGKDNLETWA